MEAGEYISEIRSAANRFSELLAVVDLEDSVPTCPGWSVRDLAQHLGGIHRWATRIVADARSDRHWMDLAELGGAPTDAQLGEWFGAGADGLVAALEMAPDDLDCWTFVTAPTPKLHWARRQAHETAIHRVDVEVVADSVTGFDAGFAADGIDELVMAFFMRPNRGPRAEVPTSLALVPDDDDARWTVHFDADTVRSVRSVDEPDATVRGKAADLYAWAWNRPGAAEVWIEGDPAAADRYRSND